MSLADMRLVTWHEYGKMSVAIITASDADVEDPDGPWEFQKLATGSCDFDDSCRPSDTQRSAAVGAAVMHMLTKLSNRVAICADKIMVETEYTI